MNIGPTTLARRFHESLLVASSGDGTINALDPASGTFPGALTKSDSAPIAIEGLRRIAFSSGSLDQATDTRFYAAGPDGERRGVYGRIDRR
jgi:hypothetical protein